MKSISFGRAVFSILGLALALLFVFHVWSILIPFLLGLVLAYLVQPLVDRFVAMGLRRDRTVMVFYALLLVLVVTAGFLIVPSVISEANTSLRSLPTYAAKFNMLNDELSAEINKLLARLFGVKARPIALPFRPDALAERLVTAIPENISSVAHLGMWIFIIPFVAYFALAEGKNWLNTLFNLTPSEHVENLLGLMAEVNATLGGYARGQLLDATCVGAMTTFGLWLLGFDQALLMGLFTGLLNPVPFLAPIVGGGLTLLVGYFQGMPAASLFGIFFLFALVRLCDDFIFTPFIVGQSVKLHPVIMLFAILAGVEVGGFLGLVFAVPAAAVLKVVLSAVLSTSRENVVISQDHIV